MFRNLQESVESALMERATLLVNHVLAAETVALERLRAHSGSSLRVEFVGWPQLLPAPPLLAFRITPAGLVEWLGAERPVDADLRIDVDASNPALAFAQALGGIKPKVEVAGSAAFAADIDWLIANLRWDIQDDLARVVGAAPAHQLGRLARAAAAGLRAAVRTVGGLVAKGAAAPPDAPGGPPPR